MRRRWNWLSMLFLTGSLSACAEPTPSLRAYDQCVPPQSLPAKQQQLSDLPKEEREKKEIVARTVTVIATKYIKPRREDYRTLEQFKAAVKLNGSGDKTAVGTKPRPNVTIAANLDKFPPGTIVWIRELKLRGIVEDTGKAMRNDPSRIDIFSNSKKEAIHFGKRELTMDVLVASS